MFGAILGDMIGAPYEFDRGKKTKKFPLFVAASQFTDDTVMTIAVAEALLGVAADAPDNIFLMTLLLQCGAGAESILMPDTAVGLENGSSRLTLSLMAATATGQPCAYLPPDGCMTRWRKQDALLY